MEKSVDGWDRDIVVTELTQGRNLASELKTQIQSSQPCERLLEKILSSYDNALTLLNLAFLEKNPNGLSLSSPRSSEDDSGLVDSNNDDPVIKKRKTLAKWSERVKVCRGTVLEGPLDDGYNWRKYGQKDILGAKFPRAYYRCTHRNTQGCLATKHVQRTDEDTSVVEVTYRGNHTCIQERPKQKRQNSHTLNKQEIQKHETPQKTIILKDETQEFDAKDEIFPSFQLFLEPHEESDFSATYSPPLLYPTPYFSRMNSLRIPRTSESDFTDEMLEPVGDLDFSADFDCKFLETSEYF